MLECGTPVEADTGNARNGEVDRQHVALFARGVVTGCAVHGTHPAVRKDLAVETSGSLGVLIVP